MKQGRLRALGAAGLGALLMIGLFSCNGPAPETEEVAPTARVRVASLEQGRIERSLTLYGTVVAAPDLARTVTAPFACRVKAMMVVEGQQVAAGEALIEIEPSPETRLDLDQARAEYGAAKEELKQVQERVDLQLATRLELAQSRQRVESARIAMAALERQGAGKTVTLRAESAGLVSRVTASKGGMMGQGEDLLELVSSDESEVRLGVELEDRPYLHDGQTVEVVVVNESAARPVTGRVRLIGGLVNPETRLVDVLVRTPAGSRLLLNEYVRGRVVISAHEALKAPRAAVLPEEGRHRLFTVVDGKAREHEVKFGLDNGQEVEVSGEGLAAGAPAVVVGASELEDGMRVEVEPDK